MKLKYWVSPQYKENPAYNVIGKTRKEVLDNIPKKRVDLAYHGDYKVDFTELYHMEMEYQDKFDLFAVATGIDGGRSPAGGTVVSKSVKGKKGGWAYCKRENGKKWRCPGDPKLTKVARKVRVRKPPPPASKLPIQRIGLVPKVGLVPKLK